MPIRSPSDNPSLSVDLQLFVQQDQCHVVHGINVTQTNTSILYVSLLSAFDPSGRFSVPCAPSGGLSTLVNLRFYSVDGIDHQSDSLRSPPTHGTSLTRTSPNWTFRPEFSERLVSRKPQCFLRLDFDGEVSASQLLSKNQSVRVRPSRSRFTRSPLNQEGIPH